MFIFFDTLFRCRYLCNVGMTLPKINTNKDEKKMSRELFFDMFCLGCDSLESVKVVLGVILKWKSRSFMSSVFEIHNFTKIVTL